MDLLLIHFPDRVTGKGFSKRNAFISRDAARDDETVAQLAITTYKVVDTLNDSSPIICVHNFIQPIKKDEAMALVQFHLKKISQSPCWTFTKRMVLGKKVAECFPFPDRLFSVIGNTNENGKARFAQFWSCFFLIGDECLCMLKRKIA